MAATLGNGASFTWDADGTGGGASVLVGQVTSISTPAQERATVDVTSLGSSNDHTGSGSSTVTTPTRQFLAGFNAPGDMTIELQWGVDSSGSQSTNQEVLYDSLLSGAEGSGIVVFSSADTCSFSGFVTSLTVNQAIDEVVSATVTIKVSGAVTIS